MLGPVYNAAYLTKYINEDLYETFLIGGKPKFTKNRRLYFK